MKKSTFCLIFSFLIFQFYFHSCKQEGIGKVYPIRVINRSDSSTVIFYHISIFEPGKLVKDTFADWDGNISINNKSKKILVRMPGYYPKYVSLEEIKDNSIITIRSSPIMDSLGGMATDTKLNEMNTKIEEDIAKWNAKHGNK